MDDAAYQAHIEALEANIAALCRDDAARRERALDRVDRLTWAQASRTESARERHVKALVSVISELRSGELA